MYRIVRVDIRRYLPDPAIFTDNRIRSARSVDPRAFYYVTHATLYVREKDTADDENEYVRVRHASTRIYPVHVHDGYFFVITRRYPARRIIYIYTNFELENAARYTRTRRRRTRR